MTTLTEPTLDTTQAHGNPWRPSLRGTLLVTRIELLRRRPSRTGWIVYGLLVAAILGMGVLAAVNAGPELNSVPLELTLVLVLGIGTLVAPSLSATSINGDSGEGVLAPLQMTRLTAGDLAFGKLLSSWAVAVALLVTTTPTLVYAYSRSGWHLRELLAVLGAILLMVLVFTAVGLAWSAIAARAVASVSLAHLTTGALVLGGLIVFAMTAPLVTETVTTTNRDFDTSQVTEEQWNDPAFDMTTLPCIDIQSDDQLAHTEKTAWMLLLNPVVVVAELSPIIDPETYEDDGRASPGVFAMIHSEVSGARLGPEAPRAYDGCVGDYGDENAWAERQRAQALMPPAPWLGLSLAGALGVGSMVIVVRRLRVPYKTLRAGSRVA